MALFHISHLWTSVALCPSSGPQRSPLEALALPRLEGAVANQSGDPTSQSAHSSRKATCETLKKASPYACDNRCNESCDSRANQVSRRTDADRVARLRWFSGCERPGVPRRSKLDSELQVGHSTPLAVTCELSVRRLPGWDVCSHSTAGEVVYTTPGYLSEVRRQKRGGCSSALPPAGSRANADR